MRSWALFFDIFTLFVKKLKDNNFHCQVWSNSINGNPQFTNKNVFNIT